MNEFSCSRPPCAAAAGPSAFSCPSELRFFREGLHLSPPPRPISSMRSGSSFRLEACVAQGCRSKGCLCSRGGRGRIGRQRAGLGVIRVAAWSPREDRVLLFSAPAMETRPGATCYGRPVLPLPCPWRWGGGSHQADEAERHRRLSLR